jgi:hypothetical protein
MATFTYEFEELPLVIANGIPAGQINGCAELTFDRNGNWEVQSVCVEGYQTLTQAERSAGKLPLKSPGSSKSDFPMNGMFAFSTPFARQSRPSVRPPPSIALTTAANGWGCDDPREPHRSFLRVPHGRLGPLRNRNVGAVT